MTHVPLIVALILAAAPPASPLGDDEYPMADPAPEPATPDAPKKAKKLTFKYRLRVIAGARLTDRGTGVDADGGPIGLPQRAGSIQLRQARARFDAKYRDILRVRLSLEASDFVKSAKAGRVLRDAWTNVKIRPGFQIRAGNFKRPYSRIELRGMSKLAFIGRGLFNDYAVEDLGYGDRAVGAGMWGAVDLERPGAHAFSWAVTASNAALSGAPNGVDLHARLTWDPVHWLSFGGAGAFKSVQDPLANEAVCRSKWTRGAECRRRVFGGGIDLAVTIKGLYASAEANLAQDWRGADDSPWILGALAHASYDLQVGSNVRLQPVVVGEFIDTNLSYAETEAIRAVAGFNVLWKKRLRIMPQASWVIPLPPVTAYNSFVPRRIYGVWLAVQI